MSKQWKVILLTLAIFILLFLGLSGLSLLALKVADQSSGIETLFVVWLIGFLIIMPVIGLMWVKLKTLKDKPLGSVGNDTLSAYGDKLLEKDDDAS